MSEKKMAAAALLVSVFVAGALAGFAVFRFSEARSPAQPRGGKPPGGPPGMMMRPMMTPGDSGSPFVGMAPMWITDRLSERLGLTDDQREKIQEIMDGRRSHASRVLDDLGPVLQAQLDSMQADIRDVLTPEQRERFDEFQREGRDVFRRRSDHSR
ncbi:hypothetical protein ACFL3S_04855 [Gemmatimonadota bacterium]